MICGCWFQSSYSTDFEHKLKTLGFEVDNDQGHIATLDLKEQRERERLRREAEQNKANIHVTEKVVTTVTFDNGQKVTKKDVLTPGTPSTMTILSRASGYKQRNDSFTSDETSFEDDVPQKTIEIKQSIQLRRPSDASTASDIRCDIVKTLLKLVP